MKDRTKSVFLIALVCCLGVMLILSACMGPANNDENAEMSNSQYMSQVNSVVGDLRTNFENFTAAVSDNDLVGMRTQTEKAFRAIGDLEAIEAPEAVKGIHQTYVDGCKSLQEALNGYIDLYSEIETATEKEPFDYKTYGERIEKLQKTYDEGVEKLKEADNMAVELQ